MVLFLSPQVFELLIKIIISTISAMAAAFFELNKIQHQDICYNGLQITFESNRQTTIARQEKEIQTLKRKVAQMQEERDHFRDHCAGLHEACYLHQDNLMCAKSKLFETIDNVVHVQSLLATGNHKDCPQAVANIITGLEQLGAEMEDMIDSDFEIGPESEPESEEEAVAAN